MNSLYENLGRICVELPQAIGCGEVWVKFAPEPEAEPYSPPGVYIAWRWRDMHHEQIITEREFMQPSDMTIRWIAEGVREFIRRQHKQQKHP
jgi:hypothetical protein